MVVNSCRDRSRSGHGYPGRNPTMTVERAVPFSTVFNFRDLGGYPAADGRRVRWARVYCSDGLWRLSADDFAEFASLGVRTVLDLRRPDELAADGRVAESLGL